LRTHTDQTREARIRELIARLEDGKDVQARDLKIVLGAEQYKDYKQRWCDQKELRAEEKPDDVVEYEALLKEALLAYAKYGKYCGRSSSRSNLIVNRSQKATELLNAADSAFERALEFLSEAFEQDPSIQRWFDRNLDFAPDSLLSIDPVGMPRAVSSRSLDNQSSKRTALGLLSKREVKLEVLRDALERRAEVVVEMEEIAKREKLRSLMKRLRDER
jgi:hypothetical protein